jgi:hypothetical protein
MNKNEKKRRAAGKAWLKKRLEDPVFRKLFEQERERLRLTPGIMSEIELEEQLMAPARLGVLDAAAKYAEKRVLNPPSSVSVNGGPRRAIQVVDARDLPRPQLTSGAVADDKTVPYDPAPETLFSIFDDFGRLRLVAGSPIDVLHNLEERVICFDPWFERPSRDNPGPFFFSRRGPKGPVGKADLMLRWAYECPLAEKHRAQFPEDREGREGRERC